MRLVPQSTSKNGFFDYLVAVLGHDFADVGGLTIFMSSRTLASSVCLMELYVSAVSFLKSSSFVGCFLAILLITHSPPPNISKAHRRKRKLSAGILRGSRA